MKDFLKMTLLRLAMPMGIMLGTVLMAGLIAAVR